MRRRFLTSTILIALTAIILLGVPLGFVLDRLAREATISRLERSAATIAVAVEPIVTETLLAHDIATTVYDFD